MRHRGSIGGREGGAERVENPTPPKPAPPHPRSRRLRLRPTPPTGSFVRSAGRQQRLTGRRLSHGVSVPPAPAISPTNGTPFFPLLSFFFFQKKKKQHTLWASSPKQTKQSASRWTELPTGGPETQLVSEEVMMSQRLKSNSTTAVRFWVQSSSSGN